MSNAGQVALGIVGGVVGFAVGGPTGAAYGLQLGLAVGNIVSPTQLPGTFGPRLNDKRTTTATLGAPITEVFGTDVVSGTVMWLGDVVEIATTEEVGGKGGPEGENTTFSYTQSIAIGLCRGPMIGLLRVWENGKLVYDVREQQDGESTNDYNMRISAAVDYANTFTLYLGDELQLADPTLELKEGVGNVPAFRGLMYIVYTDRQLKDDQGLRHPSFKFEISAHTGLEALAPLAMVSDAPGSGPQTLEPYSLVAQSATLAAPLVTQFEDTYDVAAIAGLDICGDSPILFAVGQISTTQFWARVSFDSGATWEPRQVAPTIAIPPDLPTEVRPRTCDMSTSGRIVVAGDIQPGNTPTLVYTDNEAGLWLSSATALGVEADFRFALIRYIRELDIWLCGGHRGIAKSPDGEEFEQVLSSVNYNPLQFAYGDGAIAALRSGSIDESTDDGETWTEVYAGGFSQRAIAYGNGVWVRWDNGVFGITDPGFSVASDLAGPWSALARPVLWDIYDIAYDGAQFIAVGKFGSDSLIGVSEDGIAWEAASVGDVIASKINRVHQLLS